MGFAVCVTFELALEHRDIFLSLMSKNASTSLEREAGCSRFDVWTDEDRPAEVFLYEIYDSPEAFQVHLQSDHFLKFDAEVADMIINKKVSTFQTAVV